jgi:hypothetical protein
VNDKRYNQKIRATLRDDEKFVITGTVVGAGGRGDLSPAIQIEIPAQTVWVHESQFRLETQEWRPYDGGSQRGNA